MYENLSGKTLLVMDRTSLAACAVNRAKELGMKTIVANFYETEDSPSKQVADVAINIDISDIDAMCDLVKEYEVDGIFVGWTDSHLPFYQQICERTGLPCCGTKEQFDIYSEDKQLFKTICKKYGINPVPQYNLTIDFCDDDLKNIQYPVLIKPADESGARGIKKCNNEDELKLYYTDLYNKSKSKKILVERYMGNAKEVFFYYTMQNGEYSVSGSFTKHIILNDNEYVGLPILHVYPSQCTNEFLEATDKKIRKMLSDTGMQNGIIMFQGFYEEGEFYFFESGLRMGGEQHYVFTKTINGIDGLDMMLNFSVEGNMGSCDAKHQNNPYYSKSCCNYYVSLKAGEIALIEGVDDVKKMPEVLGILPIFNPGKVVPDVGSLDKVCFRIHVMADTQEKLANALEKISSTLCVMSTNGEEMQLEHLSYERALEMIKNS